MDMAAVNAAIQSAHNAHLSWRKESFAVRAEKMRKGRGTLARFALAIGAALAAEEMGKPIKDRHR